MPFIRTDGAPFDVEFLALMKADVWGEHPRYGRENWWSAVEEGDTNCGYWEWAQCRKERLAQS